jgi:hypothetical protein
LNPERNIRPYEGGLVFIKFLSGMEAVCYVI